MGRGQGQGREVFGPETPVVEQAPATTVELIEAPSPSDEPLTVADHGEADLAAGAEDAGTMPIAAAQSPPKELSLPAAKARRHGGALPA